MPRTANDILAQEFLQVRAKILEIAAFFDRLEASQAAQAAGEPPPANPADPRQLDLLRSGCEILTDQDEDKAARVQLLFSREYNAHWREQFGI